MQKDLLDQSQSYKQGSDHAAYGLLVVGHFVPASASISRQLLHNLTWLAISSITCCDTYDFLLYLISASVWLYFPIVNI